MRPIRDFRPQQLYGVTQRGTQGQWVYRDDHTEVVAPPSIPDLSLTHSFKTVYRYTYAASLDLTAFLPPKILTQIAPAMIVPTATFVRFVRPTQRVSKSVECEAAGVRRRDSGRPLCC